MANINIQNFIDDLRAELLADESLAEVYNGAVIMAFNCAALKVLARMHDGEQKQLALPLTRGQKAARTRRKNASKRKAADGDQANDGRAQEPPVKIHVPPL